MSQPTQEQFVAVIRNSLVQSSYGLYHALINHIRQLPIHQQQLGMQKALLDLDTGMLWIKELINVSPIILETQAPPPHGEPLQEVGNQVDPVPDNVEPNPTEELPA